jgi:branched-chain amino acid transport system substrate-binding protein
MKRLFTLAAMGAAMAAMLATGGASAQELRIGFINSLNHPIGKWQVNGFRLGLEHSGWKKNGDKIHGVPVTVEYCDDQVKPDVGLSCAKKFIEQSKVQIVAGIIWSNVLNALRTTVVRNKTILMSTNAGSSLLAGRNCSRYYISTSWENQQNAQAMGQLVTDEGVKRVFFLGPNYQAGKDNLNGFRSVYKGRIIGTIMYKLGNRDFQSELTRVRAARPEAVVTFSPGPMGIAFMKQWAASGLGKTTKLYQIFVVDHITLLPIGKAAVGTFHTNQWDSDSKRPANQKFIKAYIAKYKIHPNHFVAQAYDGALLIASGIKGTGGKVNDNLALMRAMRKADYASVRGKYRYNVNGIPIQNFYKREVVLGADGKPMIRTVGLVAANHVDSQWKKCKKSEWIK